jgi:hypothetical protein
VRRANRLSAAKFWPLARQGFLIWPALSSLIAPSIIPVLIPDEILVLVGA